MAKSGTIKKKVYDVLGSKAYLIIDWERIGLSINDNTTTIKYTPKLELQGFNGACDVRYSYKFGDSDTFSGIKTVSFDSNLVIFPFVEITSKNNSNGKFNQLCQFHVEWLSIQKFSFDLSEYLTIEAIPVKATLTRVDNFNDEEDLVLLYLLLIYGFNHMIRFNSAGKFNLPVGNVDFNKNVYNAICHYISFMEK